VSTHVSSLAIDPLTPQTLYAGTSGGIFKSTDGGGSWNPASNGLPRADIRNLMIDPLISTHLYVGVTWGGGVFKSTDGGANWRSSGSGLPVASIHALSVDPIDPNILYAGTAAGLFKSTDGGKSWGRSNKGLPAGSVSLIVIHPVTPTTLFAGTSIGVFKSVNGGEDWHSFPIRTDITLVNLIAVDPTASDTFYAATDKGIFKTTNGGGNWNQINNGLPQGPVNHLIIHPGNPVVLYAGTPGGVFRSGDGGKNWRALNAGLNCKNVRNFVMDPLHPETIYAGTKGGGVSVFKQVPVFSLSYPMDGEEVRACSCDDPPPFGWVIDQEFMTIEIEFSTAADFSTLSERVTGSAQVNEILIKPLKWKKILILPGEKGGSVYWKAVGKRMDGTKMESNIFSISVRGPEPPGNPDIFPTKKNSFPILSWQKNCNTKFKVWFGNDSRFAKKASFPFDIKNPTDDQGTFSKTLTSVQWMAIKRLVKNVSGSTLSWYIESWDALGRCAKTDVMRFALTD
jgi:photosystem II stability/assembly factor-like uncharacterized protein